MCQHFYFITKGLVLITEATYMVPSENDICANLYKGLLCFIIYSFPLSKSATLLDVPATDTSRIHSRALINRWSCILRRATMAPSTPHGKLDWDRHWGNIENVHFFMLSLAGECSDRFCFEFSFSLSLFVYRKVL